MPSEDNWIMLLDKWNSKLQPRWNELIEYAIEWGLEIDQNAKSILRPCASRENIIEKQNQLGLVLPDSYLNFLKVTNGAWLLERPFELLTVDKIGWMRNLMPDAVKIWEYDDYDAPDELYLVYGKDQDSVQMRSTYVKDCLVVSSEFDTDIFLLNPLIKTQAGEWEAWLLSPKNPGAKRYRSFWEMMQNRLEIVESYLET